MNVPEGANSFACELAVDPGQSVFLHLVDQAGAPVTNAVVWGRNPEGSDHGDHGLYDESVVRIGGLEPGKPRTVMIQHNAPEDRCGRLDPVRWAAEFQTR